MLLQKHFESLWVEFKSSVDEIFQVKFLKDDLLAGLTISFIAVPLSLAIALASGVTPGQGLITAIVAGIVCAIFGGSRMGVSGPAAAMAVLVASIMESQGLGGLIFVGLICGFLQLFFGFFGFGKLARFVPLPVIAGFTAGIGAIILVGQLPRVFGLPASAQSNVADVLTHLVVMFGEINYFALFLALGTLTICKVFPRYFPKIPATFFAVFVFTLISVLFKFKVDSIGQIPNTLPWPQIPSMPKNNWWSLLGDSLIVFSLASLETLLSCQALDKLAKGKRHNSNLELIGQGMGNIVSSLFGGIPVTNVIARSALNISAGGKTRRAAIFHSFFLLLFVYFFSPYISQIPIPVLAGVLMSVSLKMLHPRELIDLWHSSRIEVMTFFITFLTIVFVDLIAGVQAGIVVAMLISLFRMGKNQSVGHSLAEDGPYHLVISGPLSFLSASKLDEYRDELSAINHGRELILNLKGVTHLDASSAGILAELIEHERQFREHFCLVMPNPNLRKLLFSFSGQQSWAEFSVENESDIFRVLPHMEENHPLHHLVMGVNRFRLEVSESHYSEMFSKLADEQKPHTLFITCSDSRIDPNLITATRPGELFIVRNVGNIIPPFNNDSLPAEGAAIEFAVGVLGVKNIIVCAHSNCGAMKEVVSGQIFTEEKRKQFPSVAKWLDCSKEIKDDLINGTTPDDAARLNVRLQMDNIKTYPIIKSKMENDELKIHAWFYNIGESQLLEWGAEGQKFFPV